MAEGRVRQDRGKRIRRTSAEAKAVILDAAQKRLREEGPMGIRLQDLAADVGVSHPAILHHFGSRDGLIRAVLAREFASLGELFLREVRGTGSDLVDIPTMVASNLRLLSGKDPMRLLAWLFLEGGPLPRVDDMVRGFAEASYVRLMDGGWNRDRRFEFEDMLFVSVMVVFCAVGMGVIGDPVMASAGLAEDPAAEERFRQWMGRMVERLLSGEGLRKAPSSGA